MNKSSEILSLPIFSIADGKEVEKVRGLLIDAKSRAVEYLVLENPSSEFSLRAIPFKKVVGIGDFAVTIEDVSSIVDLANTPSAHDMVKENIRVIGNKVMTKKGSLMGEVTEFFINEYTGKILGCLLVSSKISNENVILADNIVTFGKQVVIVSENISDKLVNLSEFLEKAFIYEESFAPDQKKEADSKYYSLLEKDNSDIAPPKKKTITEITEENVAKADSIDETVEETVKQEDVLESSKSESNLNNDIVKEFEERQTMFLKGKKAIRDLVDNDGKVIVTSGTVLDEEIIAKVSAMGRNKLLELSVIAGE